MHRAIIEPTAVSAHMSKNLNKVQQSFAQQYHTYSYSVFLYSVKSYTPGLQDSFSILLLLCIAAGLFFVFVLLIMPTGPLREGEHVYRYNRARNANQREKAQRAAPTAAAAAATSSITPNPNNSSNTRIR